MRAVRLWKREWHKVYDGDRILERVHGRRDVERSPVTGWTYRRRIRKEKMKYRFLNTPYCCVLAAVHDGTILQIYRPPPALGNKRLCFNVPPIDTFTNALMSLSPWSNICLLYKFWEFIIMCFFLFFFYIILWEKWGRFANDLRVSINNIFKLKTNHVFLLAVDLLILF